MNDLDELLKLYKGKHEDKYTEQDWHRVKFLYSVIQKQIKQRNIYSGEVLFD